jgi:enamine deaminase RidA (YjgF/YER057c/UK114 family)
VTVTRAGAVELMPLAAGGGLDPSRYTFSDGLQTPWGVLSSGQTASEFDPESGKVVVRGDAAEQTRTVFRKLSSVVSGAGLKLADVTHVTEFVPTASAECRADIERARRELLGSARPVVSSCVVEGLLRPGAHLEVEIEASPHVAGRARTPHVLPTLAPLDKAGHVVAPGDAHAQVTWCLDRAAQDLAADGLQLAGVVVTCTAQAVDEVVAACGEVPSSCRGVTDVGIEGASVTFDCVGAPAAAVAAAPFTGTGAVASATKIGDLLHVYGLRCADTDAHPRTVDQAGCVYGALQQWLSSTWPGATVLKTIEAVTVEGLPDYRGVGDVRRRFLSPPWPVSSGLIYASLPQRGSNFQIDVMVAAPERT